MPAPRIRAPILAASSRYRTPRSPTFDRKTRQEGSMSVRRENVLFLVTLTAAVASGLAQAAPGTQPMPDLSGVWVHSSITGYEPLLTGPTSLTNLRRRGITSDN